MKTQQTTASTFYIPSSQTSDFDFKAQAGKYLFHWPIIVLTMLLAAAVAYFYLQVSSPVYELNATLLIKDELKNPNKQQPLEEIDQLNIPKIVENELEILKSRTLISQVVDTLDLTVQYTEKKGLSEVDLYQHKPVLLSVVKSSVYNKEQRINITIKDQQFFYITEGKDTKYLQRFGEVFSYGSGKYIVTALSDSQHFVGKEFQILIKDRNKVIDQYQKKLETELINKQAPAVRLKIKDKVVARGKDVLDQLILLYNYSNVLEKNRLTKRNIDFIDSRIAALSGEMNKAELDVELYKTSLGLTDIPSQSKIYLENVQSTDNGMNSVAVQLNVVNGIKRYFADSTSSDNIPSTLGINDANLDLLIAKYSDLKLQQNKMSATMGLKNPLLEPINKQMQTTRMAILSNIEGVRRSLQTTRESLRVFGSKYENSIKKVPRQERTLLDKKRKQEIKETVYTYLLRKREEVALSYASILSNSKVVDYAYQVPASIPRKPLIFTLFSFGGLLAGIAFIFTKFKLNKTITTREEIENIPKAQVLMELSYEKAASRIITEDNNPILIEQFRMLRTKIANLYPPEQAKGKVTLFASSVPNEGKSFVCSNLAASFSLAGKKTIILDLDLRRPKMTETFNLSPGLKGIKDYLKGECNIDDIIEHVPGYANLDIISSSSITRESAELFESDRIDTLIADLRLKYAHILIDSPALHLVSDGFVFSRVSDSTIYLIRQGFTEKSELSFIEDTHEHGQIKNIHIVFNGLKSVKYGYGYKYQQYYSRSRSSAYPHFSLDLKERFSF